MDCCINTVNEKITTAKNSVNFGFAMATCFVMRDGDKLAFSAFIVYAGILQR